VDRIHDLTKIDKWFLHKLQNIVDCTHELEDIGSLFGLKKEIILKAKKMVSNFPGTEWMALNVSLTLAPWLRDSLISLSPKL
jgi:hypothetical protein